MTLPALWSFDFEFYPKDAKKINRIRSFTLARTAVTPDDGARDAERDDETNPAVARDHARVDASIDG